MLPTALNIILNTFFFSTRPQTKIKRLYIIISTEIVAIEPGLVDALLKVIKVTYYIAHSRD